MIENQLKQLRKTLNLTQQELADRAGTTRNNIAGYETGKRTPSEAVISLLCREFNVNRDYLLTGEGPMFVEMNDEEDLIELFKRFISGRDKEELKTIKDSLVLILKK